MVLKKVLGRGLCLLEEIAEHTMGYKYILEGSNNRHTWVQLQKEDKLDNLDIERPLLYNYYRIYKQNDRKQETLGYLDNTRKQTKFIENIKN